MLPGSPTGPGSTSVEGPDLVPSAPGDVVGIPPADCPSSRPDLEANRLPDGDGPSTSRVACLRERFSSSSLSEEATRLLLSHGDLSQLSLMTHISGSGLAGVLKGVAIPFQDPPLM